MQSDGDVSKGRVFVEANQSSTHVLTVCVIIGERYGRTL